MSKELFQEFAELSKKGILNDHERRRFQFLMKTLPSGTVNPTVKYDNAEERHAEIVAKYGQRFAQYLGGKVSEYSFREMIDAGEFRTDDQSVGYWGRPSGVTYFGGDLSSSTSSGIAGGFTVPPVMHKVAINSTKQFAPLADPDVTGVIQEPTYNFPGKNIVGWDMSKVAAVLIDVNGAGGTGTAGTSGGHGDNVQYTTIGSSLGSVPPAYAQFYKNSSIFAITLLVGNELLQDAANGLDGGLFESFGKGMGEGFGRGLAPFLVSGTGVNQPKGISVGSASANVSAAMSRATLDSIFFALDAAYRRSPKCAWLMSDSTLKQVRGLVDDQHRPLLHLSESGLVLYGKPVYIANELPSFVSSPLVDGTVIFGDLSKYVVRLSAIHVTRLSERYADADETGFLCKMRADAGVFDPSQTTGGTNTPPIVKAAIVG